MKRDYAETADRVSAGRREPSAALTKLFPSSHIGPGNLRHSVSTSSNAFTNMSIFALANDQRGQDFHHVHRMPGHLSQDTVLAQHLRHNHLGEKHLVDLME